MKRFYVSKHFKYTVNWRISPFFLCVFWLGNILTPSMLGATMQQLPVADLFPLVGRMRAILENEQLEQSKIHPIEQENHLSPNVLFFAVNHVSFPGCKRDYRRVLSHPHLRPRWFFITNLSNQHLRLLATRWSCYQRVILSCPNTSRECVKWYSICSRALHLIDGRSTSMIPLLNFWLMLSWWVCTST